MENVLSNKKVVIRYLVYDLLLLAFIYFIPALSHLTSTPFYLLEPMRIAIIFSIIHTSSKNTYLIALTIPLFSFLVSHHPDIYKTSLITVELLLNIFLFYVLIEKLKKTFWAMLLSILAAKIFYYMLKYLFIYFSFITGSLISTPILIQLAVAAALSIYAALMLKEKNKSF